MSVRSTNLGFPRIGARRELKQALEQHWKGALSFHQLEQIGAQLRERHWRLQQARGLDHIPSNDFSFYDHILDLSCTLGCVPRRYGWTGGPVDAATYFAMARGRQIGRDDVVAMEMSKWFDTNYHYLVPEFGPDQTFRLASTKVFDEYAHARSLGIQTRPAIVGPLTYAMIGKTVDGADYCRSSLIPGLVPVYAEIFERLRSMGADWVQIDEPALSLDLPLPYREACTAAYAQLATAAPGLRILLATYFDSLRDNAPLAFSLPVDAVHIDLCRGSGQANTESNDLERLLEEALALVGSKTLSLGLIDGRNIWRNDLAASLKHIEWAVARLGADRVMIAPSCSLLHTPVDLEGEDQLDRQVKRWLAFAIQKLDEIATLAKGVNRGRVSIAAALAESDAVVEDRRTSARIHDPRVQQRLRDIAPSMKARSSSFVERNPVQRSVLNLPLLPTTTIGSFPQTAVIRKARAAFKRGEMDEAEYRDQMRAEIRDAIDRQHRLGLDVLVHGEAERNDMVEYFGEQLEGFAFTGNGWVQSYGSRCVKPPIIFGDVSRPRPMTVEWTTYAQSLTRKVMKGMLSGPITILQWSFVRDDQPRRMTSRQIALAIRDEVADLERAGIRIIQIDEAALREGLPLRRADWKRWLDGAVDDFRLAACAVEDRTQIHTHMCYSEFNDIMPAIAAMDADVISIETSRSHMQLLDAFVDWRYPNEIGPGVYDIHSARVPTVDEMVALLRKARSVLTDEQLWINPDCGLKTRDWPEVEQALANMVAAAEVVRKESSTAPAQLFPASARR
ncbi:5-methyltetrahydropteroyltriglutamate--homocysteine methyltransferase [Povalibacter uvarum]|uniref:5-methyltetrahydropteroyltriglutamate--homocysteine methyltransferase n=1 Tax=Povalibacter uvarum TaxID=732238 RepID=A0A841HLD7_9GAMM|nr:5-methyltetrahydropteroyltriglutamate--homocysteine S-methyltransferase [Povalibacter uvarum]MBB6093018.1 5-methyltetrahydropteroyltriglutamate--homocysteine methyltransferase [Povalibacter uvarum]